MNTTKEEIFAKIPTVVEVSEEIIDYALTGAIEGGSNYWYMIDNDKRDLKAESDKEYYIDRLIDYILHKDGEIKIEELPYDESTIPPKQLGVLSKKSIIKGLELMAEKDPKHFQDLLDDADATTYDIFLQYAVMGEVVYG